MKKIFPVFASLFSALIICFQTVGACSQISTPLRKEFKEAKAVFVGKVIKISQYYTPDEQEKKTIPRFWKEGYWKDKEVFSKVTFEITKKWKGGAAERREFVGVAYFSCGCSKFIRLKEGTEYLVFATGQNFVTVCDSKDTESEFTKEKMKRLDRFWFRAWAEIYPF